MKALNKLLGIVLVFSLMFSVVPDEYAKAADEVRNVLLKLTDGISYNSRDFISSQEGSLYFTKYNVWTSISADSEAIKVKHERHACWGSNFYIYGAQASTALKTVVNIKFKAELDDYSVSAKPRAQIRFYHNGGNFHAETAAFVPKSDYGTYTARFVLNPDTKKVYISLDGSSYKTVNLTVPQNSTFDNQLRIYPVALAAASGAADAVTPLETPITFTFDEFYIYQTSGGMPSETENLAETITPEQSEEFDKLRERWRNYLTGGINDVSDSEVGAKIEEINNSAQYHWNRMNKAADRTSLFPDVTNLSASSHIRSNYNYLLIMAKAYTSFGGRLYRNKELAADIISALDWMYENEYNENTEKYDNWWEWEIGVPEVLNNIVVLMYDDLSTERIEKYEKAVNYFSPDPRYCCLPNRFVSTAANRLSMCMVVGLRGIIVKDPYKTRLASNSLNDVFGYVTSGDGFYRDGSFIQHDRHPYNGGYGVGMISDLSEIIYLLGESSYKVTSNGMDNVYDWIYKGYAPLMYHGIIMDAVTGRAASRSYNSTYCAASMLKAVLMLSAEADAENSAKLKSIAKTWITENTLGNLYTDSDISIIKMMNELMADGTVECAAVSEGNFQYAGMDRVVHNRKKYSFAVSMWSDRIYNYESILGENLKGWHTADGMTYLYNGDMTQYTANFWPTINPKRLPGTTATDADLADGAGASSLSSENRTGGASLDGMYGNACMALDSCGSGLKAKKSWFMFDDEIVALGADITNTEKTETVIDNRKLNSQGGGTLTADGKTAAAVTGEEEKLQNTKWLHLSGINTDSDVGYYLFNGADVNVLRENRVGSWQQINKSNANTYCSNSFMNLVIDHGTKPTGETYAYALLPGKSASETKSYAENPAVEIIKNDAAVQAVKNTALSVTGAVFWTDSVQTADKITCNKKASVMLRESNGELSFGISDPTQKNDGTLEITYDGAAGNVISCDNDIKVLSVYPKVTLSVNTANTHGHTLNIKLKKSSRNFINPNVLIDKNIWVSENGTYTVSGLGNVQFRAWTAPMSSITSTGDTFTITQQRKSMYKDNIQLASSKEISCRTPTVINIRYRVNAAAENTEEEAALSLYIPGVTNWKAGTGQIKLDKHSDEYKNLILLIKPDEKKIYYSSDGTTVQTAAFDGEMTQDAAEARLYTIAKPDSSMSVAGDGTAELQSAVIWEFDRIEISPYVDDGKHIRFSSFNSGKLGENIGYTAEIVNICAFPQKGAAAVAVYDADGTLAGVSIEDTGSINYNERKIVSGTVNVNKTDTTVKAFIWNNMNEMIPYDTTE